MAANNHNFSLIIPCFNESKNIPLLFDEIAICQKKCLFEIIIVNNGSTDNSKLIINDHKHKIQNFKLINIDKNIGFGNGVKMGLLASSHNTVCYTHGDLQIKIENCLHAFEIYKRNSINSFIKSKRINRDLISVFFTFFMGLYNTLLFRTFLKDIHSQPNLFSKPEENIIHNCPDDMGIDLYFYAFFKLKKYSILRFNVLFNKRVYGVGSTDLLINKLSYAVKSLKNSLITKKKFNEIL
jgi:glycosyltransferase involved in cell wall biosynthesis